MSDVAIPVSGLAAVTPYKLFLLVFAFFAFFAAINLSFVASKTEEKCDTRPGPFSSGFSVGFETKSCVCNGYFRFVEACPIPATPLSLAFTTAP